jgi:hypothetical protein
MLSFIAPSTPIHDELCCRQLIEKTRYSLIGRAAETGSTISITLHFGASDANIY